MSDVTLDLPTTGLAGEAPLRLGLLVAWSRHAPGRVGEVALVARASTLGRDDGALGWCRQRPGENVATGPLQDPHMSRLQLEVSPDRGRLRVVRHGRLPLLVEGREVAKASLVPGDLLRLGDRLLLLVVRRPATLPTLPGRPHAFGGPDDDGIVGESPAAWLMRQQLRMTAGRDRHVLVLGESGTGKELVATALHRRSPRADERFVARNAATVPESLVDAELFGHARNYPNAGMPERAGLVGEAHRGTLFLDEIGELPVALQAHLLRVLDGGEYQRLGESRQRKADLRLVCATNRQVDELKHDLVARLTFRLQLPALRDRRDDVPMLFRHLALEAGRRDELFVGRFFEDGEPRVETALIEALLQDRLPLNVRALDQVLWRSAMSSPDGRLRLTDAVRELLTPEADAAPTTFDEVTAQQVHDALADAGGVRSRAWKALGLKDRYVLRRLIKKYEAEGWSFPEASS